MLIVELTEDQHMELNIKAVHSIECRLCKAGYWVRCRTSVGTQEDLYLSPAGEYLPVHRVRMEDGWPLYEASVAVAKEELRQDAISMARAKYAGSGKTHSDFYEPAGLEVNVECNYCNAEPGDECRTLYGAYTKSHRPRLLKYKHTIQTPSPETQFACPKCRARPGRKCVTASGAPSPKSHAGRRKMVDVK